MTLRTRALIALVLGVAFALVPTPHDPAHHRHLAWLRVRDWLFDDHHSPLGAWCDRDGRIPALQVELLTSPPIEDADRRREEQQRYERMAAEWAQARTLAGQPTRVDATLGTLLLAVRAGDRGIAAQLAQPNGGEADLVAPYPSRWSLLPAVLAIGLAFVTRSVLASLLVGGLAGAIAHIATATPGAAVPWLKAVFGGAWHYLHSALWQRSVLEDFYLHITLFVALLFMTVGVVTRNGGIHGLVGRLQRHVRGPVSAQLCTFVCGILIFFDDYTNCLLCGTAMRPLTDRRRVSREKLAYIVDSTAAPVAGLSVFSTWVVYEMSQYRLPLTQVTRENGTPYTANDTFEVFLESLPFRYYSLFALGLVVLVAVLRRDFGPMLAAERRARQSGPVQAVHAHGVVDVDQAVLRPEPQTPQRARNAVLPFLVLVFGTLGAMLWNGLAAPPSALPLATFGDRVRHLLAHAHSDLALLWASLAAYGTAVALTLGQRLMRPADIALTSLRSTKALYTAVGVLFCAWSLGHVCHDLGTSMFLATLVRDTLSPAALPIVLFATAGTIAFATGTSFGTMAILLPNVVVLAHELGTDGAFLGDPASGGPWLMLLCIAAVLEGSIFGDHCSPISDTTVLSSLGAQCDHLAHVTTQLPYALLASAATVLFGYLPMVTLGPGWWPLALLAGLSAMAAFLLLVGRRAEAPVTSTR
ncbi:MAG: Na+/H+ antiporter NhaC family protein [Planctomycetes bacterium]|nr:Na+/H+ antiporter NhaC family protein [Planctomycetota bacterium]